MRNAPCWPAMMAVAEATGSVAEVEDTMLKLPPPATAKGEPQMWASVWLKGRSCHGWAADVSITEIE
jgi:hypothetical protein